MHINKRSLAVALGVFTALMVIYFTYELWCNPIQFVDKFAPPLDKVDYGTLIRARWIANRILPYGIVMIACAIKKEYRLIGILLIMRFGVDVLDGFVLTLSLLNNVHGTGTPQVMWGAYVLSVFNLMAGIYLVRQPAVAKAAA